MLEKSAAVNNVINVPLRNLILSLIRNPRLVDINIVDSARTESHEGRGSGIVTGDMFIFSGCTSRLSTATGLGFEKEARGLYILFFAILWFPCCDGILWKDQSRWKHVTFAICR
mmetsp:Transcript_5908/g.8372  ORF Transcript_5908/g.8372 Transcript_5908/m.8372 type:complete len:114 (-) Transcript_5908:147-488(-)